MPGFHGLGVNSNFARRLKKNPLGQPIDPDKIKQMKRQNGGKLPVHIPHALGGPDIGNRPGPDYGSSVKKRPQKGPQSPARTQDVSGSSFNGHLRQAPSFKLLPTDSAEEIAGEESGGNDKSKETLWSKKNAIKKAAANVSRKQQHTHFVAKKLFASEENREQIKETRYLKGKTDSNQSLPEEKAERKADENLSGSAVDKLTFAEKLRVLIMQVESM